MMIPPPKVQCLSLSPLLGHTIIMAHSQIASFFSIWGGPSLLWLLFITSLDFLPSWHLLKTETLCMYWIIVCFSNQNLNSVNVGPYLIRSTNIYQRPTNLWFLLEVLGVEVWFGERVCGRNLSLRGVDTESGSCLGHGFQSVDSRWNSGCWFASSWQVWRKDESIMRLRAEISRNDNPKSSKGPQYPLKLLMASAGITRGPLRKYLPLTPISTLHD